MANSDLSGYQAAYQQLLKQQQGLGSQDTAGLHTRLGSIGDQFTQLWTNMVGRAPTQDELNSFYNSSAGNIIQNSPNGRSETDSTNVRNQVAQYVGDTGNKAAQDYATQQLQGQQDQANKLSDLFRSQGNTAISSAENSLLDYQQRLFERLRPNLITSLQSQGLLNTGGMNEALAGKQADLAAEGANTVANLRLQNDNQANAIAYGGASAPYLFQQGQITQQPGQLLQAGQTALNANTNTYMSNLDYQHQLGLIGAQRLNNEMFGNNMQPSLGQSFLRNFASNYGTSMGSAWGSASEPTTGMKNMGGGSGAASGMTMFA